MEFLRLVVASIFLSSSLAFAESNDIVSLSDKTALKISADKKQLFYFWATWCPDCKEKLNSDLSKYNNSEVQFVTIPTDKDPEKISEYVSKNSTRWPVYIDSQKTLQKEFKVFSVPTVVLARQIAGKWQIEKTVTGKDWSDLNQYLTQHKGL